MRKSDVRAELEATAAGNKPAQSGPAVLDEAAARKHQREFQAWHAFSTPHTGERLAAPAELLTPLP